MRLFKWLGAAVVVVGLLWSWWTRLLDGAGHLMSTLGLFSSPDQLTVMAHDWAARHPNWINDYGPTALLGIGVGIFLTPWLQNFYERRFVATRVDNANGWSVSITVPNGLAGMVAECDGQDYSCIIFQQFRFANVSAVRKRMLDIAIYSKWHSDGNERVLLRTDTGHTLTPYHKGISESAKGDRMVNCIAFPLHLGPSDVVEGQIIAHLPEELRDEKPAHIAWRKLHRGLRFVFRDQISGQELELKEDDFYDATKGYAVKRHRRATWWARLRARWLRWRAKRS